LLKAIAVECEMMECVSVPLQALPEGLVGVDPGGQPPVEDVIIVPLPPEGLLKIGTLLTQLIQAVEGTCT